MTYSLKPPNYTLVFGLGQTGASCVQYCYEQGDLVRVLDTRTNPPHLEDFKKAFPTVELFLSPTVEEEGAILDKVKQIIVSPGIDLRRQSILQSARARNIPIIGDVELFAQKSALPYVAITGSNGKTTVTTLVGELLRALGLKVGVGGNIGTPILDLLAQESQYQAYVLELSSFQLDTTYSLKATAATILNITPDHLDRYDSYEDYILSKKKILQNAQHVIAEPTLSEPILGGFGVVSQENKLYLAFHDPRTQKVDCLCLLTDLALSATHDHLNILSALSLARVLGASLNLSWDKMRGPFVSVLKTFRGLEHRCQWVGCFEGITWINDSKGTNIGASIVAIHSMLAKIEAPAKLVLIAGGEGKQQDFDLLKQSIWPVSALIRQIILIGKDAEFIQSALGELPSVCLKTLSEAVELAAKASQKGDIVLLSPSCSSLDQYSNYIERGQDFIRAVNALTGKK